jgi:signal peptidase I
LRFVAAGPLAAAMLVTGCSSTPRPRVFRVPSSSMEPTLQCARPTPGCTSHTSDVVAVRSYGPSAPRRFDIVVFTTPQAAQLECGAGGTFIKRLIGLPGDTVTDRRGWILVNGKPLTEPYISAARRAQDSGFGTWHVQPAHYFLLGDNRGLSCDSRIWGSVPRKNLIGKVYEIERGSTVIHIR